MVDFHKFRILTMNLTCSSHRNKLSFSSVLFYNERFKYRNKECSCTYSVSERFRACYITFDATAGLPKYLLTQS